MHPATGSPALRSGRGSGAPVLGMPGPAWHTGCRSCIDRTCRWQRDRAARRASCAVRPPPPTCRCRHSRKSSPARACRRRRSGQRRRPGARFRPRAHRVFPESAIGRRRHARRAGRRRCLFAMSIAPGSGADRLPGRRQSGSAPRPLWQAAS